MAHSSNPAVSRTPSGSNATTDARRPAAEDDDLQQQRGAGAGGSAGTSDRAAHVRPRGRDGDPGPDEVPGNEDPDVQEDLDVDHDDVDGGGADRPVVDVERE